MLVTKTQSKDIIVDFKQVNLFWVNQENFTVKDIAEAAQCAVPGSELIFKGGHTDSRTYRVSFERILYELKDYYRPEWDLNRGGRELVEFFDRVGFSEEQFRGRTTVRLKQLTYLQKSDGLDDTFRMLNN